tara:strand:- start:4911 stop:5654 length:744 start_codon:yes stop_codon:yes gene_type:complete
MITMGFFNQPRDDKVADGGDDAWFITNSVISAFGVADGVGSWRVQGINAGHCAREIMKYARETFVDGNASPYESLEIAEEKSKAAGSTTALVAYYQEGLKLLDVSQVGDCNLIVIRENYVIHQTKSGVRYHDSPYQIGQGSNDTMYFHSEDYTFQLQAGDIIVAATDGLWDNMFPTQVLQLINNSGLRSPSQLANVIGTVAYELSKDTNMWSPFAQNAYEDRKVYDASQWKGGKTDDITLVVAVVES